MTVSLVQNFFKQTVTTPWTTGTGNFYVSQKPSVTSGFLVISPNSESLREIVSFSAVGTDGGGDYVTVSARGLGGTTEQAHSTGEKVYMNITAQHIEQIQETFQDVEQQIATISNSGALNASTSVKGVVRLTASPNVSIGNPTITIASPAVVTLTAHGLTQNDEIQFTTDGALPTGVNSGTTYYVIGTGLTANTFQFSSTFGGAAVDTSGSQSGVHTLTRVTPRAVSENDPQLPSDDEKAAMAGNSGTPSGLNKFVTESALLFDNAFGSGADGDVVLTTNTTLTADKFYKNLTVNVGVTLNTNGYRVYVAETLLNNGTIASNGNNGTIGGNGGGSGVGGTGGIGGAAVPAGTLAAGKAGGNGGAGAATSGAGGAAGTAGAASNPSLGSSGAAGGAGGDGFGSGGVGAGGAAGVATTENCQLTYTDNSLPKTIPAGTPTTFNNILFKIIGVTSSTTLSGSAGSGGGGGGEGWGGAGSVGGAGGGGGAGSSGGVVLIIAKSIVNNGTISANGGNGGGGGSPTSGASGGGGGGAGGSGGVICLGYKDITVGTIQANGGTGGAGGTGFGAGVAGTAGVAGKIYRIQLTNVF